MACRVRELVVLNLAALRRAHSTKPRKEGLGRRTFLTGAAAAALGAGGAGKAAAVLASGALQVRRKKDRAGNLKSVTLALDSTHAWTVDTSLYDGNPVLEVEESAQEILVRLNGALLPGTAFAVNFTARIKQNLLARKVAFEFEKTGVDGVNFTLEGSFDAWVRGEQSLETRLCERELQRLAGRSQPFHAELTLEPATGSSVSYYPSGAFELGGEYQLRTAGHGLAVQSLIFGPVPADSSGVVESGAVAITQLEAVRASAWRGKQEFVAPEGWTASGTFRGFDRLSAEIHSPESALVTLEGEKSDWKATSESGLELKLEQPKLVFLRQSDTSACVLAARLHEKGEWITFKGGSVEVGPHGNEAEALFACVEGPDGEETFADVQAGIRNASFDLEGAITTAHMERPEPISLVTFPETGQAGTQIRPNVLRPPVTTPTTPAQRPGIFSRLDVQATLKFRLAPFRIDVVRREDMLAVSFEFVNLSLSAGGGAPVLQRTDATKPSYVAVIFPPQNLAEAHFQEGPTGAPMLPTPQGYGRRPIPARLSGESRLVFFIPTNHPGIRFSLLGEDGKGKNGLLDWLGWKPSVTATAISSFGNPRIRIDQQFLNPIDTIVAKPRIGLGGLRIPPPEPGGEPDEGLFASIRKLTGRRGPSDQGGAALRPNQIRPLVTQPPPVAAQPQARVNVASQLGKLAPGIDPTIVFKFIPKGRIEPNALHTQIEMPIRLIISPTELSGWSHNAALPANPPNNKFALWHTRLGNRVEGGTGGPTVYLYSDDGKSFYKDSAGGAEGPFPVSGSRNGPTIRAIDALDYVPNLTATSKAPMPEVIPTGGSVQEYIIKFDDRTMLVDSMCWRGEGNGDTEPFDVENLMLTSLGGYLKGEWVWRQPTGWSDASKPALITWRHVATLGRDQYIKLVYKGYLFPTGHKAVLIKIAERKFQVGTDGKMVAYMRSRRFVAIRDPLVTFSGSEVNSVGFTSITCTTLQGPILDPFPGSYGSWSGAQAIDKVMLLYSGNNPVLFNMKGIDTEGNTIQWGQPSIFIRSDVNSTDLASVNKIVSAWEQQDDGNSLPLSKMKRSKLFGQNVAFAPGGGKTPAGQDAEGNTTYPVLNMLLSGKVNTTPSWPLDVPRWKCVLHKAKITAPAVQIMQGKPPTLGALHLPGESFDMEALLASTEAMIADSDDGFDVKFPDVFKQSGFGSGNKSQMFLELVEKYAPTFDDVSKTGGLVNPNMMIQGLSKGKGPIGGDMADILNGNVDPKKIFNQAKEYAAYLLGAVNIWDILPNPIKIDPGGSDSPYIELLLLYDDGKTKPPTGAKVSVKWVPPLQNWPNTSTPLFQIKTVAGQKDPKYTGAGKLLLDGSITTKFKGGSKPEMKFVGSLEKFRVDLIAPASFLILDFDKIEFIAEVGKPFDVNVDLKKMTFTGPLTFIQKLQDLVNGNSVSTSIDDFDGYEPSLLTTADPGIDVYLDVDETGIKAGLKITLPTVSVGMLAIRNISFGVELNLPFFGDPLSARFNFCERNNTFQIAVMGVTGGGFVAMTVFINGNMTLEAAFEFGGSLSIDLGVASGGVSIMGGIYFRLDIVDDHKECMVEAYIRINGNLSVLGIIRINLEFYLSMTYYSNGNKLVGTASITVEIEILFFSISVGVTVQRQLAGEKSTSSFLYAGTNALPQADESTKFTEVVNQTQWAQFCEAYA